MGRKKQGNVVGKNVSSKNSEKLQNPFKVIKDVFKDGDIVTKLSFLILGFGNLCRGQIVKGMLYLLMECGFIFYLFTFGAAALGKLVSLGTVQQSKVYNETTGIYDVIKGDNSMLCLLYGVTAAVIILLFLCIWYSGIKSALKVQEL